MGWTLRGHLGAELGMAVCPPRELSGERSAAFGKYKIALLTCPWLFDLSLCRQLHEQSLGLKPAPLSFQERDPSAVGQVGKTRMEPCLAKYMAHGIQVPSATLPNVDSFE